MNSLLKKVLISHYFGSTTPTWIVSNAKFMFQVLSFVPVVKAEEEELVDPQVTIRVRSKSYHAIGSRPLINPRNIFSLLIAYLNATTFILVKVSKLHLIHMLSTHWCHSCDLTVKKY